MVHVEQAPRALSRGLCAALLCIAAVVAGCGSRPSASPPPARAAASVPDDAITFVWPARGITVRGFDGRTSRGIDILGQAGDPVVASSAGRVTYAGSGVPGYGNLVIVRHNASFHTVYAHNRSLLVRTGQNVAQGQKIAEMGSSGTDGVKLHFELRRARAPVDPEPYLRAGSARGIPAAPPESGPPRERRLIGSGFAVTPTQVVTNAHVVADCKRVELGGRGAAKVRATDARNDLALLEAELPATDVAPISPRRVRQGDPVTVVGFPLQGLLATGPQVTAGNVTALAGMGNNTALLQISAPVQPGNSGGPLVDEYGHVIGAVVSKLNVLKTAALTGDIPQNINFAIALATLRNFLDVHEVRYQLGEPGEKMGTADVFEIARPFTAQVECVR